MSIVITPTRQATATVVAVSGEVDLLNADELERALQRVVQEDTQDVVLDLSETAFLDSTALGVLVGVEKGLTPAGRAFKIVCPNPRLMKIFRISRLDSVWPMFDSLTAATDTGH